MICLGTQMLSCLAAIYHLLGLNFLLELLPATHQEHEHCAYPPKNSGPVVDLDYEVYQGSFNPTTGLNAYLGIRFAQDTSGQNRWQAPKTPILNRSAVIPALTVAPRCPQGILSPGNDDFDYRGSEDCLFLNVFSPVNASNLPVYVWIHGGGYGLGDGSHDPTQFINGNNNSFIGVSIQYRLSAFGFLSSDEVARFGTLNVGLLDQHFSLEWVQRYISRFGGDPRRVTISGASAGGGSVVLQTMARGGTEGTRYFLQAAVQSPYLPFQHDFNASEPSRFYHAFAAAAGCSDDERHDKTVSIFECLVAQTSEVLQAANAKVSGSTNFGAWAFLPVTDGGFLRAKPSEQLSRGNVNGLRSLIGNNANEGVPFVPGGITSEDDFVGYIRQSFAFPDNETVKEVLQHYPMTEYFGPTYATTGVGPPGATALEVSQFATGQQQRAYNLYSEVTFVCPSYWLAEAYTKSRLGGYKYQFSLPPSLHGSDQAVFNGPRPVYAGPDLYTAFQRIMGNFITTRNPSISSALANGARNNPDSRTNPASQWPKFSVDQPRQINLNQTGGILKFKDFLQSLPIGYYSEPGLINDIELVDANTWESNRGSRCDFWKSLKL